jgi:hypothetical protein
MQFCSLFSPAQSGRSASQVTDHQSIYVVPCSTEAATMTSNIGLIGLAVMGQVGPPGMLARNLRKTMKLGMPSKAWFCSASRGQTSISCLYQST